MELIVHSPPLQLTLLINMKDFMKAFYLVTERAVTWVMDPYGSARFLSQRDEERSLYKS
jgi:hypothetical protein